MAVSLMGAPSAHRSTALRRLQSTKESSRRSPSGAVSPCLAWHCASMTGAIADLGYSRSYDPVSSSLPLKRPLLSKCLTLFERSRCPDRCLYRTLGSRDPSHPKHCFNQVIATLMLRAEDAFAAYTGATAVSVQQAIHRVPLVTGLRLSYGTLRVARACPVTV